MIYKRQVCQATPHWPTPRCLYQKCPHLYGVSWQTFFLGVSCVLVVFSAVYKKAVIARIIKLSGCKDNPIL